MKLYPVSCLTVQATSFCNLDCKYCYLPDRNEKRKFDISLIPRIFENLEASALLGNRLYWNWHAGEPLVAGYSFYHEATRAILDCKPEDLEIVIGMQTNATLVDLSLARLFRDHDYVIGVSIDGPAFLHDSNRTFRNGKGSFAATMKGVDLLQLHAVPFHVICVLTRESLRHPEELYHFFRSLGPTGVAFNIEEIEGIHRTSSMSGGEVSRQFDDFFETFFSLHLAHGEPFAIREWDRFRPGCSETDLVNGTTVPFDHLTVGTNGDWSTFSPELATQEIHPVYGSFVFGNIRSGLIKDAVHQPGFRQIAADIRKGVRACSDNCSYYGICGGGMVSNKLHENGSFASTSTMYCTLMVQQLSDVVRKCAATVGASPPAC